ncbi:hypothetical protein H4R18_002292 [Coemansia javaensis]|uniref:DUF924 domain-containing protein n=1 Tax=Coemansia javaensis TaxID=2761396 RepID=A0A9W8HI22_9FUNG|nr:hypothetical protein H4R18_002292 [Coemansia javaensis]
MIALHLRAAAAHATRRAYATRAESQALFERINRFWFGESDRLHAAGRGSFQRWWFEPSAAVDEQIREQFGAAFAGAAEHVEAGKETADGTLALIVLLDQMGRNMFRGRAQAYAGDPVARSLAMYMVRRRFHEQLRLVKRSFVYMPLMHAEDMEAQDLSVQLYSELAEQLGAPDQDARCEDFGDYARLHRDVIRDFGRFPSRNAALGRESTPEELEWLKSPPF